MGCTFFSSNLWNQSLCSVPQSDWIIIPPDRLNLIHPNYLSSIQGWKVTVFQGATGSCNRVIVCLTPAMPKKMPGLMNSEWDSNFSSLLCIIAPMPFPIARLPVRLNWKRIQLCIYYHMLYTLFSPSEHVRTHCAHVGVETHTHLSHITCWVIDMHVWMLLKGWI